MLRKTHILIILLFAILLASCDVNPGVESNYNLIDTFDLKLYLNFLTSDDFKGRDTPSPELKIAAAYLASLSDHYNLSTVMPDSSFYQEIALTTRVLNEESTLKLKTGGETLTLTYPTDFSPKGSSLVSMKHNSEIVFLGYGFQSEDRSWDDLEAVDFKGKAVVILDPVLPDDHVLRGPETRMSLRSRAEVLISKGASLVIKVIDDERENWFVENKSSFDSWSASQMKDLNIDPESTRSCILDIRQEAAAAILGIGIPELKQLFDRLKKGEQLKASELKNHSLEARIIVDELESSTRNVLAVIEGSNPALKDEFIVVGAHYDHIGSGEGNIYNGANDNGSGTVALIELAEALSANPPARSVILAWFTGEEQGLWGSEYMSAYPPVPIEHIKACINLDVISGFDLEKITVIGNMEEFPSLNESILDIAENDFGITADYMDDNPRMQHFFYTHSDQYPFIQKGIPSVWLGAESDEQGHIHQSSDIVENICFEKVLLVTQFTYLLTMALANAG
jgi:hypothetical protein